MLVMIQEQRFVSEPVETKFKILTVDSTCPTRYRTRHFFNISNTNKDIATKFEQECICCVRNEEEFVCSLCEISLQYPH
jgi:hypothetical protein